MADVTSMILFPSGIALALYGSYMWYAGSRLAKGAAGAEGATAEQSNAQADRIRELEQKLTSQEKDLRKELEATTGRLREAEAKAAQLESAPAVDGKELEQARAERQKLQELLDAAQARTAELEATTGDADALQARAAEWEAKASELEKELKQAEESAEARLAKLQQMSEKQAAELRAAREQNGGAPVAIADDSYLSGLIDTSGDGIVVVNTLGEITRWNPAATSIYQVPAEDALGRSATDFLAAEGHEAFEKALDTLTAGAKEPQALSLIGSRGDGSSLPLEAALAPWAPDATGEAQYLFLVRDTSARQAAEDARRDKEAAEEANRAKSQFLANMSHELRTPLNAIIGFSEILYDRTFGELAPKQERYVSNILSSGRHLLQLINDILDLSKIEAGRVQLDLAAFAPLTAVKTVDNLVKALLQKKNITLAIDSPATLPPLIADQAKFKQILYNLLSNAIKFTPENGKVTVTLSTLDEGSVLQIAVTDTGIGIKPEDQDRIFKEFEQVDSSYARQQQGTGLGLALVQKFVQMHHGRIWVSSEGEGKGSTFTFTVPFAPPSEKPETAQEAAPAEATAPTDSETPSAPRKSRGGQKAAA